MKKMLIDANQENEVRVAIVESKDLLDFESESLKNERVKGNIYLAKIIRVEPSLQAAFVDYGAKKHGFLAYNEIHPDYFKIPTADKKKLLEQEIEESQNIQINEEENDNFLFVRRLPKLDTLEDTYVPFDTARFTTMTNSNLS